MKNNFLTLEEVAQELRISVGHARRIWPGWVSQGVNPVRLNGSGRKLLFDKNQINRMVESWRVQQ